MSLNLLQVRGHAPVQAQIWTNGAGRQVPIRAASGAGATGAIDQRYEGILRKSYDRIQLRTV